MFPIQKIESTKKTKDWSKQCIDAVINHSMNQLRDDTLRMLNSYKLVNSMLDEEDIRSICSNLGISVTQGKKYVEAYNMAHNIYATVKGEELGRPFVYGVTNIAPKAMNEELREQEYEFRRYMDLRFKAQVEILMRQIQVEIQEEQGQVGSFKASQMKEDIEQEVKAKYGDLLDGEALKNKLKDRHTAKERAINKLMRISLSKQRFQWLKNQTFGDAVTAGKELVEIRFESGEELPRIRQLNPLNVFYHKSPDTPYIQESDYAGYKERLTFSQVIDLYGEKMSKAELRRLETSNMNGSYVYGLDDKGMFLDRTPGATEADAWIMKQQAGMNPVGDNMDPFARVDVDGKAMGIPHFSQGSSSTVIGSGLYGDDPYNRDKYITVYTVYWKSYRKVYKYNFINEYGKLDEEIVDESFVIPSNAKKKFYTESKFGPKKFRWVWYDDMNNYNSAEEIWIPEVWKGVRISDIYVEVGPLEHAYQSLLSPYRTKLPIYGYIYNSRNTTNVSMIDRLKPWQKLYYIIMSKLIKLIAQDKGVLTFMNMLMIDQTLGLKKTLEIAEENNIIAYNPLAYSKGGQFHNTIKVAESVDATNSKVIDYYIKLLEFIENKLKESVGMSAQRLAQTRNRTTATDNQRETMHSMNITESLFYDHDLLWEEILQGYMEMLISSVNDKDGKIKGFLDEDEIAIIDLGLITLEDEYLLKVGNNIKNNRILEQSYALAHALVQNDKANLSTLVKLMKNDDLNEFIQELEEIEKEISTREERIEQMRTEEARRAEKLSIAAKEDEQKARLNEIYLKGLVEKEKEHIRGKYMITSYNMQLDQDANAVPDLMDNDLKYTEMLRKIDETSREQERKDIELRLRGEELEQRKVEHASTLQDKDKDRQVKREDIQTKERIAKSKPKPASSK